MLGFDFDHAVSADHEHVTGFVEVSYLLAGWIMPIYMYQAQDTSSQKRLYQQHDVGVLFMPIENLRFRVRYGYTDDREQNELVDVHALMGF